MQLFVVLSDFLSASRIYQIVARWISWNF